MHAGRQCFLLWATWIHRFNPYSCLLSFFHPCSIQYTQKALFSASMGWTHGSSQVLGTIMVAYSWPLVPQPSALHLNATIQRLLGVPSSLQHAGRGNSIGFTAKNSNHLIYPPLSSPPAPWGSPAGSWLRGLTEVSKGSGFHFHFMFIHGAAYTGQPSEVCDLRL